MAVALRPVVILMLVASVLFVIDGIFDGVYPGGPAWFTGRYENLAEIAYLFAIVNTAYLTGIDPRYAGTSLDHSFGDSESIYNALNLN